MKDQAINHLADEWKVQQSALQWNFDIIEKQRNYAFIFFAAIFGITGSNLLKSDSPVWMLVAPIVVILLCRVTSQVEFINIRMSRMLEIETKIEEISACKEYYRTIHKFTFDFHAAHTYVMTYVHIFILFTSILVYSLYRSHRVLEAGWYYVYLVFYGGSAIFVIARSLLIGFSRRRMKIQKIANKSQ